MKNDKVYLLHIIEEINKIEKSIDSKDKSAFLSDVDIIDATVRRIEIIGEATKNISRKLKDKHPNIEWKKIAGTRDILIHAYFSVDNDLIWDIITKDLKVLKDMITNILEDF